MASHTRFFSFRTAKQPRRQTEVEQRGDFHRFQEVDGVEREAFAIGKFCEVRFAPGKQFLGLPLAVRQIGKVGVAVGQVRACIPGFALQRGERDGVVQHDEAKAGVRMGVGGESNQFHGDIPSLFLNWISIRP